MSEMTKVSNQDLSEWAGGTGKTHKNDLLMSMLQLLNSIEEGAPSSTRKITYFSSWYQFTISQRSGPGTSRLTFLDLGAVHISLDPSHLTVTQLLNPDHSISSYPFLRSWRQLTGPSASSDRSHFFRVSYKLSPRSCNCPNPDQQDKVAGTQTNLLLTLKHEPFCKPSALGSNQLLNPLEGRLTCNKSRRAFHTWPSCSSN